MIDLDRRSAVIRLVGGYMVSHAMRAGVRFGVFTALSKTPGRPTAALAKELALEPARLQRLLNVLASNGLLEQAADGTWRTTAAGDLLVPESTGSLANFVENFTSTLFQGAWEYTEQALLSGDAAFNIKYGQPVYEYFSQHAEANALFNRAMREEAMATAKAARRLVQVRDNEHIVDLGGGNGTFMVELLASNPTARGTVFDSSAGVAQASDTLEGNQMTERCSVMSGSFFEAVPEDGSLYILKSVLQDWDDKSVSEILAACRRSMPATARLLIIGNLLPDRHSEDATVAYLTDLCMLMISGGRERTEEELRTMLSTHGFNPHPTLTTGPLAAIEATPDAA